jgi:hypothetical protein
MAYNKYQEGKIYLIRSPSRPDIDPYYGSTILPLQQRLRQHEYRTKTHNMSSKILIDCGDAIIELVEDFPSESKIELEHRERLYIENNKCINNNIPTRTDKEYYQENKDTKLIQYKEYYKKNREEIIIKKKEYYENNKEKKLMQRKEYYERHKDKICMQLKEKYTCICGSITQHGNKTRHERTQRHINYISTIDI